jgi:hypothetical protein
MHAGVSIQQRDEPSSEDTTYISRTSGSTTTNSQDHFRRRRFTCLRTPKMGRLSAACSEMFRGAGCTLMFCGLTNATGTSALGPI